MQTVKIAIGRGVKFIRKNWFIFFAIATYIFFSMYYMGPAFTKCSDSLYGFGDSTAGPIWKNSLTPEQPLFGGYQTSTNYPYGESIYSPVAYASTVQSVSMKVGSELVGPVCAYNLYNIVGYVLTAIVMFAFIMYLTKKRWIALLAGYAVAFTPYIQSKVGGHPSYGYAALLVAALWLTIHVLVYKKTIHAVLLAIVLAICAYFDPYFILLVLTVVIPTVIAWLGVTIYESFKVSNRREFVLGILTRLKKPILIAVSLFIILVLPLVIIRIKDAEVISSSVGNSRGNVTVAAMQCSNTPIDYILPDPMNIHLVKLLGNNYTKYNIALRNWCGSGESRVSLSLTMIGVTLLGLLVIGWELMNKRRLMISKWLPYSPKLIAVTLIAVGLAGLLLSLPPYVHNIITPSGIVLKLTEMWRIFAREYLIVNMVLVIVFALILSYLARSKPLQDKKMLKMLIFVALWGGILFEYQINNPFSPMTFSYSRDVPSIYKEVRDNKAIQVIAEYPIDRMGVEHDSTVYYVSMQAVHKKQLFNSALVTGPQQNLHLSLRDLTDPQTLPALRYLGIQYLIVHGESLEAISLMLGDKVELMATDNPVVYALTMVRQDDSNQIALISLKDGPLQPYIIQFDKGNAINLPLSQSPLNTEFEALQGAVLSVKSLKGTDAVSIGDNAKVCFDLKMAATEDNGKVKILDNGLIIWEGDIDGTYKTIRFDAKVGDDFSVENTKGYNMRVNNLNAGCYGKE